MPMTSVPNRAPQHPGAAPHQAPMGSKPMRMQQQAWSAPKKPRTAAAGGGMKPPKGPNTPSKGKDQQPHGNPLGKGQYNNDHHSSGKQADYYAMHKGK